MRLRAARVLARLPAGWQRRPVVAAALVVVLVAIGGFAVFSGGGSDSTPAVDRPVAHVIVIAASGLRWEDVDADRTPALWALAGRGSIGSLSVRAAASLTCPADGWVTLGAGARSRGVDHPTAGGCPAGFGLAAPLPGRSGDGQLFEQTTVVDRNDRLAFGSRPGALADGLRCVGALGRDAAVAGAHPSGRIDRYAPTLPANPAPFLSSCQVTLIGLDAFGLDAAGLPDVDEKGRVSPEGWAVPPGTAAQRRAAVESLDRGIARVDSARPSSSLLLVAGVADASPPPRLHVAIADGPGFSGGWLTSASTQKDPFVQLIDVASTVYGGLGVPVPPSLTGQAWHRGGERPAVGAAIHQLVDADAAASAQRPLVQPFFSALVVLNLALLALATLLFRWRARRAEAVTRRAVPFGLSPRTSVEVYALWVAALLPASFIAHGAPWWRLPAGGAVHILSVLLLATAITALARAGAWGRTPLGPPGCIAVLTAGVLGLDVVFGSALQLNSLAGYSPLVAGRFTGFGNLAFAVFATAALLGTAFVAQRLAGRARLAVLIVAGIVAVIVVGGPGADVGGILTLAPACTILVLRASGVRLSLLVLAGSSAIGIGVVTLFAMLDYARPAEERTHLGRFVAQLDDGTAAMVIRRKAEANLSLLVDSQLTLLVLAVLVFVPLVLLHASGGMRRVIGLYVCVRAGIVATAMAAVIGFAVNDSGIAVPAFALALAVPLAIASSIRVSASAAAGVGSVSRRLAAEAIAAEEPGAAEKSGQPAPGGAGSPSAAGASA